MVKHFRIAFFTPSFLPKCSGAEIFHHNLASRLVEAGHHVAVILPRRYLRELAGLSDKLKYDLIPYPANTWSYFKRSPGFALLINRLALARLQRQHRFDLWHGVVTYPTGVCLINWQEHAASKGKSTPYLVRSVGDDVLVSGQEVGLRRDSQVEKLIRGTIPQVRMMIALSETMRLEYLRIGVPAERLATIPNAVNLARFHEATNREETRALYGLARNGFVFLAVGRNHPQKDYPTLLDAILQLRRVHNRPFQLLIAGRDAHKLEPEVSRRGLQETVRLAEVGVSESLPLTAFTPELPTAAMIDLYRAADAFVMSSLLEGFSSALLEAMAAALPVIVTDSPGCAEFVREDDSGLIVPPRDPAKLAQAMAMLMEDEQTRKQLSVRASQRAAQFDWPRVLDRYLQIYDQLVGTQKPALPSRVGSTRQ
jgi:glycosyltransferase involved in cell wall biosynthesis